jgi:starch-binding outer membrane protein SusE/F
VLQQVQVQMCILIFFLFHQLRLFQTITWFKIQGINFYYSLNILALPVLLLVSCKKEGEQFFVKEGSFKANTFTATVSEVVLTAANDNVPAVGFVWPAANFGEKPAVKYTLQLDVPSDTTSSKNWAKAKNIVVGNNILTYDFIVKDLNDILNTMGLSAGTPNTIVTRIKAEVPQYNGSTSSIAPVYSNTSVVKITSYSLSLYIPGGYQGWNPGTAPLLNPIEGKPGLYEAFIYMPGSGPQYFKYTNAPDWDHTNYGDGGNGTFSTDGLAGGLSVPDGGYYEVTANMNNNTWTAVKTTWGILGDATPGGWNTDTQLTYDAATQVWKVTCNMVSSGSFKFRANNAWTIDFGIDGTTKKLVYADNPFFGYTADLWNLSVPSDGNYTITLDLHDSQHYTYSLVKN